MKTRVVVIQRHAGNVYGIQEAVRRISEDRDREIIFTSNLEEFLEATQWTGPLIVFSGQILGPGMYGTELASIVKRINPKALFFIYSVMPDANRDVDGIVPKDDGTLVSGEHSLLARILTSDLDEATPQSLQRDFPQIQLNS